MRFDNKVPYESSATRFWSSTHLRKQSLSPVVEAEQAYIWEGMVVVIQVPSVSIRIQFVKQDAQCLGERNGGLEESVDVVEPLAT